MKTLEMFRQSALTILILVSLPKSYKDFCINLDNFIDYTYTSEYARKADKINFIIGNLMIFTTIYLLGVSPGKYYFYWMASMLLTLFFKRSLLFKSLGYQFYLIDYCYVCNITIIAFVFYLPNSEFLYHA